MSEELELKYDHRESKAHKSARSLGKKYRLRTLVPDQCVEEQWRQLYCVGRAATTLKLKQRALYLHSTSAELDAKIAAEKRAEEFGEARRLAIKAEATLSRKRWHHLYDCKKYFCSAKGFVNVSMFANDDGGEYVACAAQPHHLRVIAPIHFTHTSLDASLKDTFLKGNTLTIERPSDGYDGDDDDDDVGDGRSPDDEGRLSLALVGVPFCKAETVIHKEVVDDIKDFTLERHVPFLTRSKQAQADAKFKKLSAVVRRDLETADDDVKPFETFHASLETEAQMLKRMHERDLARDPAPIVPASPKKRRFAFSKPRVDDRWRWPQSRQ